MSRLTLLIKAYFFRTITSLLTSLDLYFSYPLPKRASFTRRIPSTVGPVPGSIDLLFYTPASYTPPLKPTGSNLNNRHPHPILLNFHGGGFTIGHARDDARWATAVTSSTPALVVSVNYRRAPTHPFPTGIEDCVSAVLWLWTHAAELNLDITRTAFSGFSAGVQFTYAVAFRLQQELMRLRTEDGDRFGELEAGRLVGLVSFYPGVDSTMTRAQKDASNPDLIPKIPHVLFRLFDESYLFPIPDKRNPLLSPGLASDGLLREALPEKMVLINCGGDQLLAGSERFRERLRKLGKRVDGYTVMGVGHGWDKQPSFWRGNEKRDLAYGLAVENLTEYWGLGK